LGTAAHLAEATPVQALSSHSAITSSEALKEYGPPTSVYLDGKGGKFFIYTLGEGARLMFKLMPNGTQAEGDLLPRDWRPARGGREIKLAKRAQPRAPRLRFKAPQAVRPPAPPDRYHPGVRLLARSGRR
jgi:hypothetical protein